MTLHSDRRGDIMLLTMDNGADNSFKSAMIQEFNRALDEAEKTDAVRGVVVTGAPKKFFSAGMDFQYVMGLQEAAIKDFFKTLFTFFHRTFLFPKPMIAALNGHAAAIALALSMAMDYRVMAEEKAVCLFPEIDVNIVPPLGCLGMVYYVIGRRQTDLAFISGRKYGGPAALQAGMVDELAAAEKVVDRAVAVAEELGAKKPRLFAEYKRHMRGETADCMLAEDLKFIEEGMDLSMFQNCDLACMQALA